MRFQLCPQPLERPLGRWAASTQVQGASKERVAMRVRVLLCDKQPVRSQPAMLHLLQAASFACSGAVLRADAQGTSTCRSSCNKAPKRPAGIVSKCQNPASGQAGTPQSSQNAHPSPSRHQGTCTVGGGDVLVPAFASRASCSPTSAAATKPNPQHSWN